VSQATRSVEKVRWRFVDRPSCRGFRAVVCAIRVAIIVGLIGLASIALGAPGALGDDGSVQTPNMFAPTSTPAFAIRDISYFVLGICAVI
jgi:hypothetical protein